MGTFIFWQALILWFICNQLSFLIKFKVYLKAGLFIILCVYLQDLMRICCNGFRKAPIWSDRFTDADRLTYLDKVSQFQVAYKVPDLKKYPEGGCWLVESLCANQDRPFLMQSNLGSYLVFRTGKNPKNE